MAQVSIQVAAEEVVQAVIDDHELFIELLTQLGHQVPLFGAPSSRAKAYFQWLWEVHIWNWNASLKLQSHARLITSL